MKLKDLIGYKLISANEKQLIVEKDNNRYVLLINDDYGDCCGYNTIKTHFDLRVNPVITNVVVTKNDTGEEEEGRVVFFGPEKTLGIIETSSSSGSGWCYGACVSISCRKLKLQETISQW